MGLTREDAKIQADRWTKLLLEQVRCKSPVDDIMSRFLGDYSDNGRRFKPPYKYGQARAVVTCQVKGLW